MKTIATYCSLRMTGPYHANLLLLNVRQDETELHLTGATFTLPLMYSLSRPF